MKTFFSSCGLGPMKASPSTGSTTCPDQRKSIAWIVGNRSRAQASTSAAGGDVFGAFADEVGQHLTAGVLDDGAVGDGEDEVVAVGAATLVAFAGSAVGGDAVGAVVVVEQGGDLHVDAHDDVAAVAAVTAVGSAEGLELLATHGGTTVPPVARDNVQGDAVDEGG